MRWKQFFTPVDNVEPEQIKEFISKNKGGDYTLLDVRQSKEYEKSRIPGAKLIPLPELTDRLDELDAEKPVYVY